MSYEETLVNISLQADATIGIYTGVPGLPGSAAPNYGKQYHFVKVVGNVRAGLSAADAGTIGVLQNKPQEVGAASTVAISGVSNVIAGGAVSAGDLVGPDANGKAVSGGVSGVALQGGEAGSQIPVLLRITA